MTDQILYLAGVVAVAWLVTFALRSLPFVLFAGKDRELPPAVERVSRFISPVIIAGLIVYSYYGLYAASSFTPAKDWAWPLLAGLLTVGLQLWKGNPLVSILAGTVLYMCLVGLCGCASESTVTYEQGRVLNVKKPLIRMTTEGLKFQDKPVLPEQVVPRLEALDIPKQNDLYVQIDEDYADQRAIWVFVHNYLHRGGYRHVIPMRAQRTVVGTADKVSASMRPESKVPFSGRTTTPGRLSSGPARQVLPPSVQRRTR